MELEITKTKKIAKQGMNYREWQRFMRLVHNMNPIQKTRAAAIIQGGEL